VTDLPILAVASNAALGTFLVYTLIVFVLAWLAERAAHGKSFLNEYFLGSRSLGTWTFALTFAATSASGGTFTGFPALIYTHGWVLALWIASYMVVPLCTMGLIGKRVNQLARRAGAITIPDLLRERFGSPAFGILSTIIIVYFMAFNLVAQFKAGSTILQTLVADVPVYRDLIEALTRFGREHAGNPWLGMIVGADPAATDWGYKLCLLLFGVSVIAYTTYGGFRAVVWTDVMQGIVMVGGVILMLPLALWQVGGLSRSSREVAAMTPPVKVVLQVQLSGEAQLRPLLPAETWLKTADTPPRIFWTTVPTVTDQQTRQARDVQGMEVTSALEVERLLPQLRFAEAEVTGIEITDTYRHGHSQPGSYVSAPGPHLKDTQGFLPIGMALSFFFMWAISGSGQPQYMVRLMAFRDTLTLRRAIMAVTLYFGVIYLPLVIIFTSARVLLPGLDHRADSVMPRMAVHLTEGIGHGWLAGLLLAAPFAAVMSTVDSYLLVVSSSLVRDVWQRNIQPDAPEKTIKRLSYWSTLGVGLIALAGAFNPPEFLQQIIVYVGSGLAACFLMPVVVALYWPRANAAGAAAGMIGGFVCHLAPHVAGLYLNGAFGEPYQLLGISPVLVGLIGSLLATIAVTYLTKPCDPELVRKYFCKPGS
jgi:Na+/proline symporter